MKKASGLAGLFSDMLSQAQKSLSLKGGEGENALATKICIPESHAMKQGLLMSHAAGNAHKTGEGLNTKLLIANRDRAKRGASKRSVAGPMLSIPSPRSKAGSPRPRQGSGEARRWDWSTGSDRPSWRRVPGREASGQGQRRRGCERRGCRSCRRVGDRRESAAAASPGPRAKVGHRSDEEQAGDKKNRKARGSEPRLSVLDLRGARSIAERRLGQVGRWEESAKPGYRSESSRQ